MSLSKTSTPFIPNLTSSPINLQSLREYYKSSLLKILDLNDCKKAIVLDPILAGIFGMIIEASILKEHNVSGFYSINTPISIPAEITEIIYFTRIRVENINMIIDHINYIKEDDLKTKTSRLYNLYYVPKKSLICEKILEENDIYPMFNTIGEFNIDLIPLDYDILSLENDQIYRELYIEQDPSNLYVIANSIIKLQTVFGLIPNIKSKGIYACEVTRLLYSLRKISSELDPVSEIDSLIILDRTVDHVTPWLTPQNYEGQLDEWLEIKNDTITVENEVFGDLSKDKPNEKNDKPEVKTVKMAVHSGDVLYKEIRDMSMDILGNFLSKKAAYLREEYDKRHKAATVSELSEWVKTFKNSLQIEHSLLQVHICLAERLSNNRRLWSNEKRYRIENAMVTGQFINESIGVNCETYLEKIIAKREPLPKILRMFLLYSACSAGFKPKRMDYLKNEILQTYEFALKKDTSTSSLGFGFSSVIESNPWDKMRNALGLMQDSATGSSYAGYTPLSVKILELATKPGGWKSIEDYLDQLPGLAIECKQNSTPDKDEDNFLAQYDAIRYKKQNTERLRSPAPEKDKENENGRLPVTIVYYIGGVTYGEISAIRTMAKRDKSRDYIIATTKVINGNTLIDTCIERIENNLVFNVKK